MCHEAFIELGWRDHSDFHKLARDNFTGILASQLCEDSFDKEIQAG